MLQIFPKATILALLAALALLMLTVACATAATPIPTATPTPTATVAPAPASTPVPTATPTPTSVPTATPVPTAIPDPTPTPVPTVTPTPTPTMGNWLAEEHTDPISDSVVKAVTLKASESDLSFPYDDHHPLITVMCLVGKDKDPAIWLAILWHEYLGSDDKILFWRVDREDAAMTTWTLFDDNSVVNYSPSQLIEDLTRADKITARVRRDFAENLTAIWHPAGFAEAYKPLAEACNK